MALTTNWSKQLEFNVTLPTGYTTVVKIDAKLNSQSTANNTSNVSVRARIKYGYPWWAANPIKIRAGKGSASGSYTEYSHTYTSSSMASTTEFTCATWTGTITHNNDGTGVLPLYGYIYQSNFSVNKSKTGSVALPTIPRASLPTITPNPFNIGDTITINTNRRVQTYTDDLFMNIGSDVEVLGTDVATSITVDTSQYANQLYALIPNATSYTSTIDNSTYDGSTFIGSNSISYTANVVDAEPTFTLGYRDTNSTTTAITGNNQQIIRNQSTLQINITDASALYGASLVSASVDINGNIYTGSFSGSSLNINVGTVDLSSNENAVVTVTDSRGLSTTKSVELQILDWQLPSAIIECARQNNYYTETNVKVDADYSSLDNHNTITITFKYKKTTDSTYTTTTLQDNVSTVINMDNLYDWDIQVIVADAFGSTTYNLTLNKGVPLIFFDRKRESVSIGCFPQRDETIEVYGVDLLQDKQDTLVSGTNIKTINNTSLLGSGNINISTGGTATDVEINGTSITSNNTANIQVDGTYNASTNKIATMSSLPTAGTSATAVGTTSSGGSATTYSKSDHVHNISSSTITSALGYTPADTSDIPTATSQLTNDSGFLTSHQNIKTINNTSMVGTGNVSVQPTLVSGTNIKTINNTSLLGSGNISLVTSNDLSNYALKSELPTKTSDLTNDSGFITGITSSDVTSALGFTPYNSTNPNGYITSSALSPYVLASSLSTVATTGDYDDLTNKPTIPTVGNAKIYYGTSSTSASTQTKVVTCSDFVLETGATVVVKFTNAQSYNGVPKLNVNSTGAINVRYKGDTNGIRYMWNATEVMAFTYDGTYWVAQGRGLATTTYYGVTKLTTSGYSTSTTTALTPASLNSVMQYLATGLAAYSSSATYEVGDRVRYGNYMYECNTAITTAEAWTAAHWTALDPLLEQIDTKQDNLVSGTNIKTINNTSLLGSGNISIDVETFEPLTANTTIKALDSGCYYQNTSTSYTVSVNTMSALDPILTITPYWLIVSGETVNGSILSKHWVGEIYYDGKQVLAYGDSSYSASNNTISGVTTIVASEDEVATKQDTLVSGTNIKTINGTSLLGSGDITIGGGGTATNVLINGSTITANNEADIKVDGTYNASTNKIATMSSLSPYALSSSIPTKTSDLTNDSGFTTNTGTVTSIATSGAITGGTITSSGTISHSTSAGYKHIPSGGSSGQYLKYSASGTAAWTSPDSSISSSSTNTTIPSSKAVYDAIPTNTNQLTNGAGFITSSDIPITDIKVNNTSVVSSGVANLITNTAYNSSTNKLATMSDIPDNIFLVTKGTTTYADTKAAYDAGKVLVATDGSQYYTMYYYSNSNNAFKFYTYEGSNSYMYYLYLSQQYGWSESSLKLIRDNLIKNDLTTTTTGYVLDASQGYALNTAIGNKQDTLVSGTNIKTINNESILGSGNISISGGQATDVRVNGTSIVSNNVANLVTESAYNSSTNKIATKSDIPTNNNQLTNGAGYITGISGTDVTTALGYTPQEQISDTGWNTLTLASGFSAATGTPSSTPQYRKIGNHVFIRGLIKFTRTSGAQTFATAASGYIPNAWVYKIACLQGTRYARIGCNPDTGAMFIDWIYPANGTTAVTSGSITWLDITMDWFTD